MAWSLIQSGMAEGLSALMTGLSGGTASFLALSIVIFIGLGSLLEGIPVILVFGPLLFPIAHQVGVNEVHYAIIVILAMGLGLFAPPFGVGYYYACAIGKVSPDAAFRKIWPYLGALLAATVLVAAVRGSRSASCREGPGVRCGRSGSPSLRTRPGVRHPRSRW
ncbi:MAG: TRAP transporter large permease subunit [Acetobacteraceae bacterium]